MRSLLQALMWFAVLGAIGYIVTLDHPMRLAIHTGDGSTNAIEFGRTISAQTVVDGMPITKQNIERIVDERIEQWHNIHANESPSPIPTP